VAPQRGPQFAVYASRAPTRPLIPGQLHPQIVRCHRARTQPQGALVQLANSNLRSCLCLYLGRLSPRPLSVDTPSNQAIQMPNLARGRVGLGVENIDLTSWTRESGEYAMSKGAICRGLSFARQMQTLGSIRMDTQKPIRIRKPIRIHLHPLHPDMS